MKTLIILFLIVVSYSSGYACSCMGESSVETEYKNSDIVVTAHIIGVEKIKIWSDTTLAIWNYNSNVDTVSFDEYKIEEELYGVHILQYTAVVVTNFKGSNVSDTIKIRTGFGGGDCGYPFNIDGNYLIYGQNEDSIKYTQKKLGRTKKELEGIFRTDICRRTALISESELNLNYLNKR